MWEPRRLATLWDSTACYRDTFACSINLFTIPLNIFWNNDSAVILTISRGKSILSVVTTQTVSRRFLDKRGNGPKSCTENGRLYLQYRWWKYSQQLSPTAVLNFAMEMSQPTCLKLILLWALNLHQKGQRFIRTMWMYSSLRIFLQPSTQTYNEKVVLVCKSSCPQATKAFCLDKIW
jgi:hypothetical protein